MASHLSSLSNLSHKIVSTTSSATHAFHGTGEALRGNINSTIDGLAPNHESREGGGRARNQEIAQKGVDEVHGAQTQLHSAGQTGTGSTTGGGSGLGSHFGHHSGGGGRHHAKGSVGQGGWLSQGGVRSDTGGGHQSVGGGLQGGQYQQQQDHGLGAAKLAWGGEAGRVQQQQPPPQQRWQQGGPPPQQMYQQQNYGPPVYQQQQGVIQSGYQQQSFHPPPEKQPGQHVPGEWQ